MTSFVEPLGKLVESFDTLRSPVRASDRKPGPYPYYGASGVVDHVDAYRFEGEYLLVAEDGANLTTKQVPIAFIANGRFWVNNHAHVVRANQDNVTKYLLYAVRNADIEPFLTGSTMPKLTQANLNRIPILKHPRATQAAIAHILSTLDEKIDLNRRMNATLEEMARALFKSWFVDFDPVHAKAAGKSPFGMDEVTSSLFPNTFQHSAQGRIPNGWQLQRISEVQDGPRGTAAGPFGSNLTRSDYVDAGVPVIRGESMTGNEPWLNDSTFVFVTAEKAEALASNTARPGDLVFTQRGTLGQVAVVPPNSAFPIYVLSQSQMRLRSTLSPLFLYFYFSSTATVEHILANSTAAGVPHINLGFLRQMTICPFSPDVVAAFDATVGPWMTKHLGNSRQSRTLAGLRDTLLPKLLSGQLRIKDAEKLVGEAT